MTSSTDSQSLFSNLSRNACKGIAARSSVRTCASAPPYRPIGVRMPSQMNAADMRFGFLSWFAESQTGHVAGLLRSGPAGTLDDRVTPGEAIHGLRDCLEW